MADAGYEETEKLLKALEIRISKEYRKASEEAQKKLDAYLERFKKKDELKRRALDAKLITKEEYTKWREQQIMVGEQWTKKRDELARDYHNANEIAKDMMRKAMPEIYAENRNYGMYQVEKDAGVNTSFTLYNKKAVEQLMNDNPEILPAPGKDVSRRIAAGLDVRWNRQQLQSVMLQSILLGDSIPEIAHRLAYTVGDSNHKAAIRNARTMTTGTQNAARVASMKDAQDIGVKLQQQWLAVHDGRTRHSHRAIDYEIQEVDHEFSNGCRYPGDPAGPPSETWNCRCSVRALVDGLEPRARKYQDPLIEGMTYDEWKSAKARSNPIDLPEKKGEAIKQSYIKEYKRYAKLDTTKGTKNGKINIKDTLNKDSLSRARNIRNIDDLHKVSKSPVIKMDSYFEVQNHFQSRHNVSIVGFDKIELFGVKAVLAGYDDMLTEFPEIRKSLAVIRYNPSIKDYGKWGPNRISEVGKDGIRDYGTGIHESAHALDYVRSNGPDYDYSERVVEQARKNLHYRKNSKDYKNAWTRITGVVNGSEEPSEEKFAYAIETAKGGVEIDIANEIYRIAREGL